MFDGYDNHGDSSDRNIGNFAVHASGGKPVDTVGEISIFVVFHQTQQCRS